MRADQVLPDDVNHGRFNGLTIRKGTVAAFLANARTWTRADAGADERAQARARIAADVPALPLSSRNRDSRERRNRLCRAARGRPIGGRERQRPWG